jgi:hypothetical protein
MKLAALAVIATFVAFESPVSCSEIFELNRYIRPFLLNQHPIFITNGNVSLPDDNFQTLHAEQISSVLVYDFKILRTGSTDLNEVTIIQEQYNITTRYYSRLIWRRFPSFIHIFPSQPTIEVYDYEWKFLRNLGLCLKTRPKINSVIITLQNSTIHQKKEAKPRWNLQMKNNVEARVDYYEFALYLKPTDTKSLSFQTFVISSVSVLKLCRGCFVSSKISFFHFENCENSPLNAEDINFNCINKILQVVSETNLNLSRFSMELETSNIESHEHYGKCITPKIFKNDSKLSFSSNFDNVFIQNVLLQELFRGLRILFNCYQEKTGDVIVINVRFTPQRNKERHVQYEFQAPASFQTQEAYRFNTCDGVRKKIDFMAYLKPFDAKTWFGTIISLAIYSSVIAILVYRKQNSSIFETCVRSLLINFSFLTGVANTSVKLLINNHLNAIRILKLSWSISKFILCIVYSSLVTSNVIAPSTLISPWTEYKQLEKFTKVFGLNNQEMLRIQKHYKTIN